MTNRLRQSRKKTSQNGTNEKQVFYVPGTKTRCKALGGGLHGIVMKITPELSKEWLPDKPVWRTLKERTVERYARHLQEERWKLDGMAVRFNKKGKMIDGQHRLHACVRTGISFVALVLVNCEQHAELDTGLARSPADFLRQHGYQNAPLLAAVLRLEFFWRHAKGDFGNFYSWRAKITPR